MVGKNGINIKKKKDLLPALIREQDDYVKNYFSHDPPPPGVPEKLLAKRETPSSIII